MKLKFRYTRPLTDVEKVMVRLADTYNTHNREIPAEIERDLMKLKILPPPEPHQVVLPIPIRQRGDRQFQLRLKDLPTGATTILIDIVDNNDDNELIVVGDIDEYPDECEDWDE